MKQRIALFLAGLLIVVFSTVALASDVSGAKYLTTVRIINTGTAVTNVAANFTLSTADMISQGMLNATATDCAMRDGSGNDIAVMPGYSSNPWVTWVSTIGASSQISQYLYSNNASGGKLRYFPGSGGMAVTDNASTEFGANFTAVWKGFLGTATGPSNPIIKKTDAFNVYRSATVAGNVTADIYSAAATNETREATADLSVALTSTGGTNFGEIADANDGTYVYENTGVYLADIYTLQDVSFDNSWTINSVTIHFRFKTNNGGSTAYAKPLWYIGSTTYNGTEQTSVAAAFADFSQTYNTSPATGLPWTATEINGASFGIALKAPGGFQSQAAKVYVVVNYQALTIERQVVVTGISNDQEVAVIAQADSVNFWMTINGIPSSNTTVFSVPDNSRNWQICSSATPYMELVYFIIGGNTKGSWNWEYNGGYFTDDSGNGNTGTPTFRTTCSDSDVTASVVSMAPVSTSTGPTTNTTAGWIMIPTDPSAPAGAFSTGAGDYVGKTELTAMASSTRVPLKALENFVAFGSAIIAFVAVFALTHRERKGIRGSLLFPSVAAEGVLLYWTLTGGGVIQAWILIPVGIWIAVLLLWRNPNTTPI